MGSLTAQDLLEGGSQKLNASPKQIVPFKLTYEDLPYKSVTDFKGSVLIDNSVFTNKDYYEWVDSL